MEDKRFWFSFALLTTVFASYIVMFVSGYRPYNVITFPEGTTDAEKEHFIKLYKETFGKMVQYSILFFAGLTIVTLLFQKWRRENHLDK